MSLIIYKLNQLFNFMTLHFNINSKIIYLILSQYTSQKMPSSAQ